MSKKFWCSFSRRKTILQGIGIHLASTTWTVSTWKWTLILDGLSVKRLISHFVNSSKGFEILFDIEIYWYDRIYGSWENENYKTSFKICVWSQGSKDHKKSLRKPRTVIWSLSKVKVPMYPKDEDAMNEPLRFALDRDLLRKKFDSPEHCALWLFPYRTIVFKGSIKIPDGPRTVQGRGGI